MQAQYASIGWSVGASLGLAAATQAAGRRVVAVIGDGAFQMTAQVRSIHTETTSSNETECRVLCHCCVAATVGNGVYQMNPPKPDPYNTNKHDAYNTWVAQVRLQELRF